MAAIRTIMVPKAIIIPKLRTGAISLESSDAKPAAVVAQVQNIAGRSSTIVWRMARGRETLLRCSSWKWTATCVTVAMPIIVTSEFSMELTMLS